MDNNTVFIYRGAEWTLDTFAQAYHNGNTDEAAEMIAFMLETNRIRIKDDSEADSSYEELKRLKEQHDAANFYRTEENNADMNHKAAKDQYVPKHDLVGFRFASLIDAGRFQNSVLANLNLKPEQTAIENDESGNRIVYFMKITEADRKSILALYNLNKAVRNTTRTVDKATQVAASVTKTAMHDVIIPVTKTGIKTLGNLAKTMITGGARVLSSVASETVNTVREVKDEIKTNPDMIKAADDLASIRNSNNPNGGTMIYG